jgi:hypothetical protein
MAWTADERKAIVNRYHEILAEMSDAQFSLGALEGKAKEAVIEQVGKLSDALYRLVTDYKEALPIIPLSRCPISGDVLKHSFDAVDLCGFWWRGDRPVRPQVEAQACPTFAALTGAVKLSEPVEYTQFVVHPGPGAPFVVPYVLKRPDVYATLSSINIGRHTGYIMAYFAREKLSIAERPTIWGTGVPDLDPNYRWDDYTPDDNRVWDFDLKPWIDSGKLSWIAPNDADLKLSKGSADCPYLNVKGSRKTQYISVGKVSEVNLQAL